MMLIILEKLNNIVKKNKGFICKCAGLMLCVGILFLCASCKEDEVIFESPDEIHSSMEVTDVVTQAQEIYITVDESETAMMVVHLCGAVNNPGVYELEVDSRVIDGIVKAGGFTDDACEDALNLAMVITDGSRIYIPTVEEVEKSSGSDAEGCYIQSGDSTGQSGGIDSNQNGLVNINTAGVDKLVTLPGIGESRAKSIIAYREAHGAFKKIEDIMLVSGIKEGAFGKIKDYITVN